MLPPAASKKPLQTRSYCSLRTAWDRCLAGDVGYVWGGEHVVAGGVVASSITSSNEVDDPYKAQRGLVAQAAAIFFAQAAQDVVDDEAVRRWQREEVPGRATNRSVIAINCSTVKNLVMKPRISA